MLRWRDPHGPDQGKDKEESLDTGRRHPDRYPLELPGRQVRYHLPVYRSPGGVAAEKRVSVRFFLERVLAFIYR